MYNLIFKRSFEHVWKKLENGVLRDNEIKARKMISDELFEQVYELLWDKVDEQVIDVVLNKIYVKMERKPL